MHISTLNCAEIIEIDQNSLRTTFFLHET